MNACEERLRRVESVLSQPIQLQSELQDLEELLRNEWPNAIIQLKDLEFAAEDKKNLEMIVKKIKKLEVSTKTKVSLFDGVDAFLKQSRDHKY